MNTVSQTFNWNRFVAALKKEVVENSRLLLFSALGLYAFFTFFMILGNVFSHNPKMEEWEMMTNEMPQTFVLCVISFAVAIMASMAFKDLTTKKRRTSLFTSPSSTLEKFIVNVLIYIVGTFVALFVIAQLADLTRIAALKLFESDNFVVPGPINFFKSFNVEMGLSDIKTLGLDNGFNNLMTTAVTIGTVSSAIMYLLGAVIWPRLSLLKTYAVTFVIETILMIIIFIIVMIIYLCGGIHEFGDWCLGFMKSGNFLRVIIGLMVVQGVAFFALAWYLFKRKDVVSLKWWK